MINIEELVAVNAVPFMVVFIRISGFMLLVPFFNNKNFSSVIKVAFAFTTALLLFPGIDIKEWVIPTDIPSFILIMIQEILIGLLIGLVLLIMLFTLELVGHLVGYQMAFSMARAVDSTFGNQSNVISVFLVLTGTMLLLAVSADHYLLWTLKHSFTLLPPGSVLPSNELISSLNKMMTRGFEIGFRLASPAIIILLLLDVVLGIIGKTTPKMQIFFVGLPMKIAIGLFSITLTLKFVVSIWGREVGELSTRILKMFSLMRI